MVVSVFEALASEPETLLPSEQRTLVREGRTFPGSFATILRV